MKQIKMICHPNGNAYLDTQEFHFDKENRSVELEISFPVMDGYHKRFEWFVNDTNKGFQVGTTQDTMSVFLTADILQASEVKFQGLAVKNEDVIKWKVVTLKVFDSLNVLQNDTTVTPSIAEILQGEIDTLDDRVTQVENDLNSLEASDIQYGDGNVEDALLGIAQNIVDLQDDKADKTYVDAQDNILLAEINALDLRVDDLESGVQQVETDISDLQNGKAPLVHTHPISDVIDLQTSLTSLNESVLDLSENKVDKVVGKQLSDENYTLAEKTKLETIEEGAEVNTVTSVATRTGDVVLTKTDVGLSNVDNTSDVNKPISTATQLALNGKAPTVHTHPISEVTNLQTALNGKANTTTTVNSKALSSNITINASDVPNTPSGNISATNVQNAINELDTEKANRVQEAWITPTLLNGWVEVSGFPVRYRKTGFGRVVFKGRVTGGSIGSAMFSVPIGYRPLVTLDQVVAHDAGTTPPSVRVQSGGNVFPLRAYTAYYDLTQLSYELD